MRNVRDISKVWDSLTDAQRDEFVKQYDRPIPKSETRPLTQAERARYERAIGRNAPKVKGKVRKPRRASGRTTQRLIITLERNLVADLDAQARKLGVTRSELIARGLAIAIGRRAG